MTAKPSREGVKRARKHPMYPKAKSALDALHVNMFGPSRGSFRTYEPSSDFSSFVASDVGPDDCSTTTYVVRWALYRIPSNGRIAVAIYSIEPD